MSFGEQLAAALNDTDISVRELARRMAAADGTKWETKRRWLSKILKGGVERPEPASVDAIAHALGRPAESFEVRRPEVVSRRTRLEALEAQVAELSRIQNVSRRSHKVLLERVQALEQTVEVGPRTRQAAPAKRPAKRGK